VANTEPPTLHWDLTVERVHLHERDNLASSPLTHTPPHPQQPLSQISLLFSASTQDSTAQIEKHLKSPPIQRNIKVVRQMRDQCVSQADLQKSYSFCEV